MVVKVYSTSRCAYCHVLMNWLDSLGVEFEEVDAESAPDIKSAPTTEINGTRITGLDRPAILKVLKKEGIIK